MKVGILLKKNRKGKLSILLIAINEDEIESILNEELLSLETNYLCLWLMQQQVEILYVQDTDDETKAFFQKLGVTIETYEELRKHPFFGCLLI